MTTATHSVGRYERVGDVALSVRRLLKRSIWFFAVAIAVEYTVLVITADPAATAFAMIGVGCLAVFAGWAEYGQGLPIIPLLALENLVAYALPIATHNETVVRYPAAELTSAGLEVLLTSLAMLLAWRIAMQMIPTAPGVCFALQGFDERAGKASRLGFILVLSSTAYEVLRSSGLGNGLFGMLPAGSEPILHVLASAASACGFFLAGMMVGRGEASAVQAALFWSCLAVQGFISAAGFLLSPTMTVLFAAIIGLYWGSRRVPWKFLVVVLVLLGFFNLGKFVMRDRYWGEEGIEHAPQFTLSELPQHYTEWAEASFNALTIAPSDETGDLRRLSATGDAADSEVKSKQTLLQRINNLQNLLYVIDVMDTSHVAPLDGATYSLIPPLLVPRILWPNKPRTHEGQVLLNVHFGRQDLSATFETYVAWGLLPEAYGNFGPRTGAIVLGIFLGAAFAWVERYLARKLLLSVEGFLAFTLLLGMANSYEMVASVLVTSVFQGCIPIVLAAAPFVERVYPRR